MATASATGGKKRRVAGDDHPVPATIETFFACTKCGESVEARDGRRHLDACGRGVDVALYCSAFEDGRAMGFRDGFRLGVEDGWDVVKTKFATDPCTFEIALSEEPADRVARHIVLGNMRPLSVVREAIALSPRLFDPRGIHATLSHWPAEKIRELIGLLQTSLEEEDDEEGG